VLPAATGAAIAGVLVNLTEAQHRLLVLGRTADFSPSPEQLTAISGFAYLSGRDAWTDLLGEIGIAVTQPDRVKPTDHRHPLYPRVQPLLADMNATFSALAHALAAAAAPAATELATNSTGAELVQELLDSSQMLAIRAEFVATLYAASAPSVSRATHATELARARTLLAHATSLVRARERHYRVSAERIASWRPNPTAYAYGYLWTVHSLLYWWRELGRAEGGSLEARLSPCYLNDQDALQVALGEGTRASRWLRDEVRKLPLGAAGLIGDCFAPPKQEYVFPRDLFRY